MNFVALILPSSENNDATKQRHPIAPFSSEQSYYLALTLSRATVTSRVWHNTTRIASAI